LDAKMGFRLANVDGKAALVIADNYYDIEHLSGGELSSDPMSAIERTADLALLSARLSSQSEDAVPTGKLSNVILGAPVPRPRNSFAIGLNYRNHA
jgi:2,4-diketo-3-deoxy-L-fuconate hydrolase